MDEIQKGKGMANSISRQSRPRAVALAVLFIVFIVPLSFSISLEDGFELTQALLALFAISFLFLAVPASSWKTPLTRNHFIYFSFLGYLAVGIYSFIRETREVTFFFPTQNYLWILSAFLFLVPIGGFLDKRKFLAFITGSTVLCSLYGLSQVLGFDMGGWNTHFSGRGFSTLGDPIFWAGQVLLALPCALHLALSSPGKKESTAWLACLGILFASLLAAQTRGAWLGFLAEAAVFSLLFWKKNHFWKWALGSAILFLLILLLIPSLRERAESVFHPQSADAQGRYFMWRVALEQWKEKPWLGQGPGGYANHFHRFQSALSQREPLRPYWTAFHAHEEYLETLAERGLAGLAFGVLFLWGLVKRRLRSPEPYAGSELALMAGMGVLSFFNFPTSVVPTACVLALMFNPSWEKNREAPSPPKPGGTMRWVIIIILLLVCGQAMKVGAQNAHLHKAIDLTNAQQFENALKLLDFSPSVGFFHYLDPRIFNQKAVLLDDLGRQDEAIQTLVKVAEAYPYDAEAHSSLCMLFGKEKKWAEAEAEGGKALSIAPSYDQALNNLAVASYLQGHIKKACGYLSRLETAYQMQGETEKAAEINGKIQALTASKP